MAGLTACKMSVLGSPCEESGDPRHEGACYRCGKPISTSPRDERYEDTFLAEAEKRCEKRFSLPAGGFSENVRRRLKMGEELYPGRHASLDASQRAEHISEEAWDAAAYAVLDAQIRLGADLDDSAAWHLFEIACHSAAIHHHATQLKRG